MERRQIQHLLLMWLVKGGDFITLQQHFGDSPIRVKADRQLFFSPHPFVVPGEQTRRPPLIVYYAHYKSTRLLKKKMKDRHDGEDLGHQKQFNWHSACFSVSTIEKIVFLVVNYESEELVSQVGRVGRERLKE